MNYINSIIQISYLRNSFSIKKSIVFNLKNVNFCCRNVLSKGGNAVDAAIATLLCDGVLCPEYMGIGGGFIMSIYNATTKKVTSINARETAPAAATPTMFVNNPKKSIHGMFFFTILIIG